MIYRRIKKCLVCGIEDPARGFSKRWKKLCMDCGSLRLREQRIAKGRPVGKPHYHWVDGYKICTICLERKHENEFYLKSNGNRVASCKICSRIRNSAKNKTLRREQRERINYLAREKTQTPKGILYQKNRHLLREYGITLADKERMLYEQNNRCAVCSCSDPGVRGWVVDHCHVTQKVRAILCDLCNKMLGQGKDSPSRLLAGCNYLIGHQLNHGPGIMTTGVPRPDDEYDYEIEES